MVEFPEAISLRMGLLYEGTYVFITQWSHNYKDGNDDPDDKLEIKGGYGLAYV